MLFLLMALAVSASDIEVTGADSVRYAGNTYRLYDVDAPQVGDYARCRREAARGEDTAFLVAELMARANRVEIVPGYDPRGRRSWPRDHVGRRLAHIRIDGRDLGELLIAHGRATPWNNWQTHNWCQRREIAVP